MATHYEKSLSLLFVPVGKRAGAVTFHLRYKRTGFPVRRAAEEMMARALVNGSPICTNLGEGIRLYFNADAFLAEKPKNRGGLFGQFFFVGVDRHGNLLTLGAKRQKLCELWLRTRDLRTDILDAYEEISRYRAAADKLRDGLEDEE